VRKKLLTMSLVLAMVLSFAACEGETGEEIELPLTQEIVESVVTSWADIRTSQFDMHMTMDMAGEIKDEAMETSMVTDSSGMMDFENKQMQMDMTMSIAVPGEDKREMGMEMYLIGDMMYMMMDVPGMGPMWMKSETPEATWDRMSQTKSQIELLKTAQVNVIGSEKVGGVDCYVLQLIPDVEQLWQLAMQQAQVSEEAVMPDVAKELLKEVFRSFSVKQWIAKDTYFLTKAEIDMTMELIPEAMGLPGEGVLNMDISLDLQCYNYNQPVSIVLPPEAEGAVEVPKP
jgi:hypothetical protein